MMFSPDINPTNVCKVGRGKWHLCKESELDRNGICVYARITGHCMKAQSNQAIHPTQKPVRLIATLGRFKNG